MSLYYIDGYIEEYKCKISKELIPLYEVMGNEILAKQFDNNPLLVYKYCLEHNVTWEEVLNHKFDPNVLY